MEESAHNSCPLSERSCVPCRGGVPPLSGGALRECAAELKGPWSVVKDHHLEREFVFPDFRSALAFVKRVGELSGKTALLTGGGRRRRCSNLRRRLCFPTRADRSARSPPGEAWSRLLRSLKSYGQR